jgi:tRNA(Ile)-lysidine synthase
VSFTSETLRRKLAELTDLAGDPGRLLIAYSGGLDSTVLLHGLAALRDAYQEPMLAVHVNHGLHEDAASWSSHCRSVATALDIEFCELRVDVDLASGRGPEAAAREARYAAFRSIAQSGDWLLSAHHKDDQAETLMLNLMRGSGPAGLAGIGEIQPFVSGWLVRPLLDVSRASLREFADANNLARIDDPSNEDRAFDRNYLRHEVMPLLESRWPDVTSRLKRSAVLAGEAATLLDQLADSDFNSLHARPDRLPLAELRQLPVERQRNLLRYVVRELGLPSPPAAQLQSIVVDLIPAREDAQPLVRWAGAEIRRYRDQVYVLPAQGVESSVDSCAMVDDRIVLPAGLGELELQAGATNGLSEAVVAAGIEARFRAGGEEIKLAGQSHTRKLKKLLQEEGIVPWMRDRLPLLYCGKDLVAVGDLWIAAHAASEPGIAIRWKNRPPIH